MRVILFLPFLLSVVAIPGRASIMTLAGYCWESDGNPNLNELIANDCTINNGTTSATDSTSNSPTGFSSTESATASSNTWHLLADATLSYYPSSLFQYSEVPNGSGGTIPFVTSLARAAATQTDGITVFGGTGNYSINFIFALDGSLTSTGLAFGSAFAADVSLAQGTPTLPQVMYCQASYCDGSTIPTTFTLTYSNLTYGVLNDLSLAFSASSYVNPGVSTGLLMGGSSAEFADTVQLTEVLVTDANGNPVPGISLTSQDGYSYPLAAANTVPEPFMLLPLALGAALVALHSRSAKARIRS